MRNGPMKPAHSDIEEFDEVDGRTYRWSPPRACLTRLLLAAFLLIWIAGLGIGFILSTVAMLEDAQERTIGFWVLWGGGGVLLSGFALLTLYLVLRPPHPESLTLGSDTLVHDSGTPRLPGASRNRVPDQVVGRFKRRMRTEVRRADLPPLTLERTALLPSFSLLKRGSILSLIIQKCFHPVQGRQCLYFDHGDDRIEIGEDLSEPDREWIAAVIEEWRTKENMERP